MEGLARPFTNPNDNLYIEKQENRAVRATRAQANNILSCCDPGPQLGQKTPPCIVDSEPSRHFFDRAKDDSVNHAPTGIFAQSSPRVSCGSAQSLQSRPCNRLHFRQWAE